ANQAGYDLYLLAAKAESNRAVPRSNSTTFSPFSQCSPWFPRKMSKDVFQRPAGFTCFLSLGGNMSYSAPDRWLGIFVSSAFSSSMSWYSQPFAAGGGAIAVGGGSA